MAAAIMVSTFGCVNGLILSGARVSFAMARDGLFFRGLDRLNRAPACPGNALWAQAAWACLLVLSGSYSSSEVRHLGGPALLRSARAGGHRSAAPAARVAAAVPRCRAYPLLPLLYAAGGGALILLLLSGNPRTTWPGYADRRSRRSGLLSLEASRRGAGSTRA